MSDPKVIDLLATFENLVLHHATTSSAKTAGNIYSSYFRTKEIQRRPFC